MHCVEFELDIWFSLLEAAIVPSCRLCSGSACNDERFSHRWHTHAEKTPVTILSQQSAKENNIPELQKAVSFPQYFSEDLRHFQAVGRGDGLDSSPFCSFLSPALHVTRFQKDE